VAARGQSWDGGNHFVSPGNVFCHVDIGSNQRLREWDRLQRRWLLGLFQQCIQSRERSTFQGTTPGSFVPGPVCFFNCTNEQTANAIYSFHPGTGGAAMCDGSVHFLSEDISLIVFGALTTFNAHDRVTDSF
jgi:Protein of unknown function (DUF1559)